MIGLVAAPYVRANPIEKKIPASSTALCANMYGGIVATSIAQPALAQSRSFARRISIPLLNFIDIVECRLYTFVHDK